MEIITQAEPTRIDVHQAGVNLELLVDVFNQGLYHQGVLVRASRLCHITRCAAEAPLAEVHIHMDMGTRETKELYHMKETGQLGMQGQLADILLPALTNPADSSFPAQDQMAQ